MYHVIITLNKQAFGLPFQNRNGLLFKIKKRDILDFCTDFIAVSLKTSRFSLFKAIFALI